MQTEEQSLLTIDEASKMLRIDVVSADPARTVRSLVSRGELEGVRVGKFLLIKESSVRKLMGG